MNFPIQVTKTMVYEKNKTYEYYDILTDGCDIEAMPREKVEELIRMLQQAMNDRKEAGNGEE